MKNLLVFFSILLTSFVNATIIDQISIPDNYRIESTFSGDLSAENSFHLIFSKEKKTKEFKVFTYLFDGFTIHKLPSLLNENASYNVVSYHQKNDVLTLLLSYKIKKDLFIQKIDYDLVTNNKTEFTAISHNDFLTAIRTKDTSILIYKSDDILTVSSYQGSEASLNKELILKDHEVVADFLKDNAVTSVKTDEFVANGAINKVRLYYEDDNLFFTRDTDEPFNVNLIGISLNNKRENTTQLLHFSLKDETLTPKFTVFENANEEKFKKATSFFTEDKLFQLALSKKSGFIKISDVHSGDALNKISLTDLASSQLKGNSDFDGMENFLKSAGKNKYNATITANKTLSDKIRVRIDYVDIDYNYNYNFWFHQQMMWQMQQDMMNQHIRRSIPSGFGPFLMNDDAFENAITDSKKRYFELLIDVKGSLLDEDLPEPFFRDIDKEFHMDTLEDVDKYKYESSCFLNNSFRFIAFDIKEKKFIIQTKEL